VALFTWSVLRQNAADQKGLYRSIGHFSRTILCPGLAPKTVKIHLLSLTGAKPGWRKKPTRSACFWAKNGIYLVGYKLKYTISQRKPCWPFALSPQQPNPNHFYPLDPPLPPFRLKTSTLRLTNFCFLGTLQGLYFIDSNMLAQIGRFGRAFNYLLGVVRNFWGGRFVFVAVFFLFFTVGSLMCLGRYKTKRKFGKNRFQASL